MCLGSQGHWFVALADFLVQLLSPKLILSYNVTSVTKALRSWLQELTEYCSEKSPVLPTFQRTGKCPVLQRGTDRYFPRVNLERWWQILVSNERVNPMSSVSGAHGSHKGQQSSQGRKQLTVGSRKPSSEQSWWLQVQGPEASLQEWEKDPGMHLSQLTLLPSTYSHSHFTLFFPLASITS